MKLEEMAMKNLLALHNRIADQPAGAKTFATRGKLVARIEAIAADKNIDVASYRRPQQPKAAEPSTQLQTEANESPDAQPKTMKIPRGKGIGALARQFLMDIAGYPHALIATMVNAQIDGAQATDKPVRWYANEMRKKGIEVPPHQKTDPLGHGRGAFGRGDEDRAGDPLRLAAAVASCVKKDHRRELTPELG